MLLWSLRWCRIAVVVVARRWWRVGPWSVAREARVTSVEMRIGNIIGKSRVLDLVDGGG